MCSRVHVLFLPTTGIPLSYFLVGPGLLHKMAVSSFSCIPSGRADTFSLQYLPSTPRISLRCFSSSILFLSASLSLSSMIFVYFCLVPAKLLYRQYLFLVFPLNPSTFSQLRYPTLFQLARSFDISQSAL